MPVTALEKARLRVVSGNPRGAHLIKFMFNPENCTVKGGAEWKFEPSKASPSAPPAHYQGVQHVTLTMNVLFDESERTDGDVSKQVNTLLEWTRPTPDTLTSGKDPRGPYLQFSWGSNKQFQGFTCVLSSVSAQYTLFRRDGTPLRAMVSLTLEQLPKDAQRQNPTSGAAEGRSAHVVGDGDTLQSIAHREYGNPAFWRGLATFNGIDDPLRLQPGTSLLIPAPAEARRLSLQEAD